MLQTEEKTNKFL